MDRYEKVEQIRTIEELTNTFGFDHRFTALDMCEIHKLWLQDIYEWAGRYRQVMMSKSGFPFAFPVQISRLMTGFEKGLLRNILPAVLKFLRK